MVVTAILFICSALFYQGVGTMKHIASRDNHIIKDSLKLKQKKYRLLQGCFLVEGKKSLEEAFSSGHEVARVFVSEELSPDVSWPVTQCQTTQWFTVPAKIIHLLSDTANPQGVVAVVKAPEWDWHYVLESAEIVLLLDQMADPGNLGTIIRTAWAFDVTAILLTEGSADPFNPKVVRSTMGGILHVPIFPEISEGQLLTLREAGFTFYAARPDTENDLFSTRFSRRTVLVIGNEARGISPRIQKLCDVSFSIPINPGVDSLNAAVACAIITVEASRQRSRGFLS